MKKRWKSVIKRVVGYGALVAFLNYFSLPVLNHIVVKPSRKNIKNRKIQQVCRTDSYLEDIVNNIDVKNCDALTLVKSAHAISSKYLSYEIELFPSEEGEIALEGKADCTYFSVFAYSNFLYLADKFERKELKNKVRLCGGYCPDVGHAWLQVYFNDKWNDYEAVYDPFFKGDYLNFNHIDLIFPNYYVLDNDNYYLFVYTQFKDGELVNHVNYFASITSGVDLKDGVWKHIKEKFKS